MKKKRILRVILIVVLGVVALLLVCAGGISCLFSKNAPIQDSFSMEGFVRTIKDGHVSVFMLDLDKHSVALIDAGNNPKGTPIMAELSRRGLAADAVKAVFFTHGHRDHIAACRLFPNAEFYALAAEQDLIEGREGSHGPLTRYFGPNPPGCKITKPLNDGDTVAIGDLPVRVFAVPGHTRGSAAYLARGVLFMGDSADSAKDGSLMPAKWIFSDNAAEDRKSLVALARRLGPGDVSMMAFAHSGALEGGRALKKFAGLAEEAGKETK